MTVLRIVGATVIYLAVGALVWSVIEGHLIAMDEQHIVRDRGIAIVLWPFAGLLALGLWCFTLLSALIDRITR